MSNVYAISFAVKKITAKTAAAFKDNIYRFRKRCPDIVNPSNITTQLIPAYIQPKLFQMQTFTNTTTTRKTMNGLNRWMISLVMILLAISLPFAKSFSQVSLYSWASNTLVSLETITSPVVISTAGNGTVDDGSNAISPVGFTFPYNGVNYTEFTAGTNGYVRMGNIPITSILSTLSSAAINGVFVFGRDGNLNNVNGGSMTHGVAAGGKYVFHFVKYSGGSGGGTSATIFADVQVVLWGSTSTTPGKIDIVWGASAGTPATSGAMGIVDAANTFVNGSDGNKVTATNPAAWPASGTQYTFTPPPPCVAPLDQATVLTFGTTTFSSIPGSFTAAGSTPSGYLVVRYPSAATVTNPTNGTSYSTGAALGVGTVVSSGVSTSFTATGVVASTTYDFYVYTFNNTLCSGGPTYNTAIPLTAPASTPAGTLSGIKTVGTGGDYDNLTTAFAAINASGLSGNIELQLITGYPVVAETFPIASATAGAGAGFNILVYPTVAGLAITGADPAGILNLNGAAKITIDGRVNQVGAKDLLISNTNIAGFAVRFINDANNNTIRYCTIRSVETSTTLGTIVFSTGVSTGNDNNSIDNCDILAGATTPVNGIYSLGTSAAVDNSGNSVSNCNIADYFSAVSVTNGILLTATGNSGWTINANRLYQTARRSYTTGNTHNAVSILSGAGYSITNNVIGFANSAGTGFTELIGSSAVMAAGFPGTYTAVAGNITRFIAINAAFTAGGAVSSLQGNTVAGINLYTSSGAATTNGVLCGINVTSGNVNIGTVTGNTIGSTTGINSIYAASSTVSAAVVGIYVTSTNTVSIQNNTIGAITTSGTTNTTAAGFTGIDVGSGAASVTITNNTIGNATADNIRTGYFFNSPNLSNTGAFTTATGTSAIVGIRSTATGNAIAINSNTLRGVSTSGSATTLGGILSSGSLTGTTPSVTANSNNIGTVGLGVMRYAVANSGTLTGISVTNTAATTHTVSSNNFTGIVYSVAGTNTNTYLTLTGATAANNVATISGNTFTNLNVNTTGSVTFIAHSYTVAATGTQTINNNSIVTAFNKPGAGGTITGMTSASSSATGAICIHTNNNFSNITATGLTAITGITNTDGAGTGATRTVTGNTFINWTTGTGTITGMSYSYFGGISSVSANTLSSLSGQGIITGINIGSSGIVANPLTVGGNLITSLISSGAGGNVTGIVCSNTSPVVNINGNTINTLSSTGVSNSVVGISITGGINTSVFQNTINTLSSSGTTAPFVYGVTVSGGTLINVHRNKIYDLAVTSTLSSPGSVPVIGIINSGGTTVNTYNNLVGDLRTPATTSGDAIRGIAVTSTAANSTYNVFNNTVRLDAVSSGVTFGTSGIWHTANATATTATLNLRNNIIINLSAPGTTAGVVSAFRRSAVATLGNYGAASNKNLLFAGVPSATRAIMYDGTNIYSTFGPAATAGTYQNIVASREAGSFTGEAAFDYAGGGSPFFISTTGSSANFLHVTAGITTQVEGGADPIASPAITVDFDGDTRSVTLPDVGADEFNGTSPAPTFSALTVPTTLCVAAPHAISVDVLPTQGTITNVTLNWNNGSAGSSDITASVSGNTYSGSIPAASPAGTTVTWSIAATNSLGITSSVNGTSYADAPLTNVALTTSASSNAVCPGTQVTLNASLPAGATIATGTASTEFTGSPYRAGNGAGDYRVQYLYLASELNTAGITPGNITSIAFNVTTGTSATYTNYAISMGNVAATAQTTTFTAGTLTPVYTAATYASVVGNNVHTFGTPFVWDGSSNVLVNICYTTTSGSSSTVVSSIPPFTGGTYLLGTAGACTAITGTTMTTRPTALFGFNGFAPYTLKWNDGATDFSTIAGPVDVTPTATTTYTFTITQVAGLGCSKSSQQVVSMLSAPATPTSVLQTSSQCGSGTPAVEATGGSPGNYRWYLVPTGGTAISGQTNATLSSYPIIANTTFYVAVTNGTCESGRVTLQANVAVPDALQAQANGFTPSASVCVNGNVILSTNQIGANQAYTFTWSANTPTGSGIPADIITTNTSSTITPTIGGVYTYTLNAVDGACVASPTSVMVTVEALPVINPPTATPSTVCSGSPVALLATTTAIGSATVSIGAGALTSSGSEGSGVIYASPYSHYYGGYKGQYIIRAAELTAAGLSTGNLNSLAFDVTTASAASYAGFTISLAASGATANTTVASTTFLIPSFTQVYTGAPTINAIGLNTYTFGTGAGSAAAFNWNGSSDIIVQVCWSNNNAGGDAAEVRYDNTTFVSNAYYRADNVTTTVACGAATGTGTASFRPKMVINGQTITTGAGSLTWAWDNGIVTASNSVTASPVSPTNTTITYNVTGTSAIGCAGTNAVTVTVNALPAAPTGNNSDQCGAGIPKCSVQSTDAAGTGFFKWYDGPGAGANLLYTNAIAKPFASNDTSGYWLPVAGATSFYVSEMGTNGCESARTLVAVTTNSTPDPLALSTTPVSPVCVNSQFTLTTTQTPTVGNEYVFTYSALAPIGSGIETPVVDNNGVDGNLQNSILVTPTAPGTYTYSVSGTDGGGCTATANLVVVVNGLPTITSAAASPSTICAGSNVVLTGAIVIVATGNAVVGTGSVNSSTTAATFFPGGWGGAKTQYIIRASELLAADMVAGPLTSMTFETTNSGQTYQGFTVQLGATAQTAMTTTFITSGLTQVYKGTLANDGYTPLVGVNPLAFGTGAGSSSSFVWDGSSNIVVSICWSRVPAASTASSTTMKVNPAGFASSAYRQRDNLTPAAMCGETSATSTGTNRPKFTFGAQVGNNLTATYTWQWNIVSPAGPAGAAGSTLTVNPLTSTDYTVSATDASGCTATSATIPVVVNPIPLVPGASNSTQCGSGVPTASVSGLAGATFKWYTLQTGGTLVQSSGASFASSISTTTAWWVSQTSAEACEGPRVLVTATVTTADPLTASVNDNAICISEQITLTGTTGAGSNNNTYNLTWTAAPAAGSAIPVSLSGGSSSLGNPASVNLIPTAAGTYVYTVAGNDPGPGCNITSTVTVTVNPKPVITTVTATPAIICVGATSNLTATSIGLGAGTATIGAGATTEFAASPYRTGANAFKMQYLYTAAELNTAGIAPGNITSLGFNISSIGSPTTITSFQLSMGHTAATSLTATFQTAPATIVFPAASVSLVAGINAHTFSTPFVWDGSSNVLVQVCGEMTAPSSTATVLADVNAGYTTQLTSFSAGSLCASASGTVATNRPAITFGGTTTTDVTNSLSWNWTPGALSGNPVSVTPGADQTYTVTATNPLTGCVSNQSTVPVDVEPLSATASSTAAAICAGASTTVSSLAIGGEPFSYSWSDGTTVVSASQSFTAEPTATTTYTVTVTNSCLQTTTAQVTVTVNPLPTVSINEAAASICSPATYPVTSTTNAASPAYQWINNAANISGETFSSYTVTASGNFAIRVTDGVTGCIKTSPVVAVTVNQAPSAVTVTPATASVCNGTPVVLTASGGTTGGTGTATLGTASTLTTASTEPTAFCNRWAQYWNQTIYTVAELQAAGLSAGSSISAVTYDITTLGDGTNVTNFSIRIGTTANTVLTAFQTTGLTTVYGPATYNHSIGANLVGFTTPYVWDGASNIVLDVRQDGADALNNAITYFTAATDNKNISARTSELSSTTPLQTLVANATVIPVPSTRRLNILLAYSTVTQPTYAWTANPTLSTTTGAVTTATPLALGDNTYTVTATSPAGCTNTGSAILTVSYCSPVWTGTTSTSWDVNTNWSSSAVPLAGEDVTIGTATTGFYPVLTSSKTVGGTLSVNSGTTITIGSNTLTVTGGILSNTGTLIGSPTSILTLGANSSVRFAGGAGATVKDLNINAGTTTLQSALDITGGTALNPSGTVTVASGAVLASVGNLTFKSNIFGTSRLAAGTGNYVTGDVTVERYIPNAGFRSWRLLSVPTFGTQSVRNAWQEGAVNPLSSGATIYNNLPNYGTQLTGTGSLAAAQAAGFDNVAASAAIMRYNGTGWVGIPNTNTAEIDAFKSYFVYVRGERTKGVTGLITNSSPTTLRTTGSLYLGDQTYTIPGSGFNAIGNLYASAIDFEQIKLNGGLAGGVSDLFYIYDSKKKSGTNVGVYVAFSGTNGYICPVGPVGSTGGSYVVGQPNKVIESGQAFMVQSTAAGSITLSENSKIGGTNGSLGLRPLTPANQLVKIDSRLYSGAGADIIMEDAAVVVFDNAYPNSVGIEDALKISNPGENLAVVHGTKKIAIEGRQVVNSADTIFFNMWNMRQQPYSFEFVPNNLGTTGLTARLEDSHLATSTPVDLGNTTTVNFIVDANAASSAANRFRIVFKQAAPLPVSFVSVSANLQGAAVKVDWKVSGERGIQSYEVERSADAASFTKVGTVTATGNASNNQNYSWLDAAPLTGVNYYRIKSITVSGEVKYTYIVKVLTGKVKPAYTISPNPVEGNVVNLQFKNQPAGRYNIRLMSSAGQAIFTRIVEHAGGNTVHLMDIPSAIARGAYQMEIIAPDKATEVQTIFINTLK